MIGIGSQKLRDMGKRANTPCEVIGGENMKGDENENLITGQR